LVWPTYLSQKEKKVMTKQVRRFSIAVVGLILVTTFTMLIWGSTSSEAVNAQGNCTLQTIEGTYIFEARGSNIDEDGNMLPYAEAGIWTLDGEGNAAGLISIGIDGENFVTKEPFTAKYEVVSDCVFEATDEFGLVVDLYTTPSGSTVTYYSPGFSGTMFKQTPLISTDTGREAQVREASAAWDEAFNAENVAQLMELYAEDAVSMPPGAPALEGKDAIQSDFEFIFDNFDV
jgi:hypothetical protein